MWENFINSEITFWVLVVADIILIGSSLVGFVLYLKDEKIIAEMPETIIQKRKTILLNQKIKNYAKSSE